MLAWVKVSYIAQVQRTAPAWDARIEPQADMGRARDTKHGTGNGRRRSWRGSKRQAYCMKQTRGKRRRLKIIEGEEGRHEQGYFDGAADKGAGG